ncbi:cytochrome P450 [Cylindrobasidium torrendii FP15055 ss-10]|uniref:Cytochrome P450 n=1 Tax=Cylindrobasidium torrendii FP15055 ss-10 TaxID=1314674 RepID=A0A0D7BCS0_9AGAR|nr:cytochrome P450 [Cylindrobasidium torrendii FP15055 ss-10]
MASVAAQTVGVVAALTVGYLFLSRKGVPKPPGPRGLPVVGNLFDMPTGKDWEVYARMSETYGPVMSLTVGPTTIIVLSTIEKVKDFFEKRGANFCSRPSVPMMDIMEWSRSFGLLRAGPDLTKTRKMFYQEFGTTALAETFFPQELDQAKTFIELVAETPENLVDHCFQHSGALILRILYGYKALKQNDPVIAKANNVIKIFSDASSPGSFYVNALPFLNKLPDWFPTAFKRKAKEWTPLYLDLVDDPLGTTYRSLADGTAEDSFCAKWLRREMTTEELNLMRYGAGGTLGGGADTTAITLYCFYLLMAMHPEIHERVQAEVDSVCGRDRLPNFTDKAHLPYLQAVIKEVVRTHPAVPLAIPHTSLEDDIIDGYFIPKGSVVFGNLWQIAHDPVAYPNPFKFDPDRFLGDSPQRDPYDYVFGIGRRYCPGRLLAHASIFITFAMSLSVFNIGLAKDENGEPIVPSIDSQPGIVSMLAKYPLNITPRFSPEQLEVLLAA